MELEDLGRNWDRLGAEDPFWAVLSDRARRGNKWDQDEFFESGRREISQLLSYLEGLDIHIGRSAALDFGCGPGRLVQGLAAHFDDVMGVDIAPSMVDLAARLNPHGDRCHFHVNATGDLQLVGDRRFDLVYTHLVLQHMSPVHARAYIAEFLRVVKPDGVVVFQVPTRSSKQRVKEWIPDALLSAYRAVRSRGRPTIQMNGLDPSDVDRTVRSAGGEVVHRQRWRRDSDAYRNESDLGFRYFARKRQ